jgi:nitrite transporter NirC
MYHDTIDYFVAQAEKKAALLDTHPLAFFIGALMAGGYIGLGIILILSVGGTVDPGYQKLVMGLSFGVALTLVVFAGSELFTGYTMYMTFGWLQRRLCGTRILKIWFIVWLGNLVGSLFLVLIFLAGGGGNLVGEAAPLLHKTAAYKMNSDAFSLVARAILCNWLVCLALWMAARVKSDAGKAIAIFWALFAFISSGYEHSVANMTLLSLSLLSNPPETVTLAGMVHNLFWVTLGNTIGGAIFMGLGYWLYSARTLSLSRSRYPASCCADRTAA